MINIPLGDLLHECRARTPGSISEFNGYSLDTKYEPRLIIGSIADLCFHFTNVEHYVLGLIDCQYAVVLTKIVYVTWLYILLISYIVICESVFPRDSRRSMVGDGQRGCGEQ